MARLTRRGAFGGAGGAVLATLAGCPSEAPAADAPLLALCQRFMTLQAHLDAINARTVDVSDQECGEVIDQQASILDQMNDLRAVTLAGHRARAATLEKWYARGKSGEFDSEVSWRRIGPLFRDLLAGAA